MYPKQTLSSPIKRANFTTLTLLTTEKSHLSLSNKQNSDLHIYEISMPYLILYQALYPTIDKSIYFEFSEQHRKSFVTSYHKSSKNEVPLHAHDFYELTIVLSGKCQMQIENENVTYYAGDCWLGNKNIHHKEFKSSEMEIIQFLVTEKYIKEILDTNFLYDRNNFARPLDSFFYNLFKKNEENPFFSSKEYIDFRINKVDSIAIIIQMINQIFIELHFGLHGRSHILKGLFCRLFEYLDDEDVYAISSHLAQLSNEEKILYNVAEAYQSSYGLLTRKQIEEVTGYNSSYVAKIVKKNMGISLGNYGKIFMLEKSRKMLIETTLTIQKILEILGYSNRFYFNRIFEEKYGMTPSKYRKYYVQKNNHLRK